MNALIDLLNAAGAAWFAHARAVAWQAGLLVALLWLLDRLMARRVRAGVRHAVWLLVPLKLMLPPDLALPTSPAYWFDRPPAESVAPRASGPRPAGPLLALDAGAPAVPRGSTGVPVAVGPNPDLPTPEPAARHGGGEAGRSARFSFVGLGLVVWLGGAAALGAVLVARLQAMRRRAASAEDGGPDLRELLRSEAGRLGLRRTPRVGLLDGLSSPSVLGLARPVVLLPRPLVVSLTASQLREVLLHELVHVQRGDLWLGHLMAVLQVLYWWHPFVWLAHARIRQAGEEATDDAVVVASGGEVDSYASTLVRVARLAAGRPFMSLGLLGIFESESALAGRVGRLLSGRRPATARLGWIPPMALGAAALVLLPMSGPAVRSPAPSHPVAATIGPKTGERPGPLRVAQVVALTNTANPATNPFAATPARSGARTGREKIRARLMEIRLPTVGFPNLPLQEVVRWLAEQAQARDPQGQGVNFLVNPYLDSPASAPSPVIDPVTGQPTTPPSTPPTNLNDALIRIDPELRDVSVYEAVQAVASAAVIPIQFALEDYAVVFLNKSAPQLLTRVFRVNPETFVAGLRQLKGLGAMTGDSPERVISRLFEVTGISNAPPRALFFNDRLGLLMARVTSDEMEALEHAIELANAAPPMVQLEARLLELPETRLRQLGLDAAVFRPPDDRSGNRSNGSMILNPTRVRELLSACERDHEIKTLAAPRVTTLSGRQAEIGTEPWGKGRDANATGMKLQLTPMVRSDGNSIELLAVANLAEAVEWIGPVGAVTPPNQFHHVISTVTAVRDGDSMVLVTTAAQPAGGKTVSAGRRFVLLVTPTIVDPAGNPVHAPENLPFQPR